MNSELPPQVVDWNNTFFDGRLTADKLRFFAGIDKFDPSVSEFVERALREAHAMQLTADDFSELLAWGLGFMVPRILPTAWGGIVPPVTAQRRHEKIDDLIEATQWRDFGPDDRILDIGCGFPPATAIDLAARFPANEVVGVDPEFGRWIVYDVQGDYAAFDDDGELRYFQAAPANFKHFDELLAGGEATRDNYRRLLEKLRPELDDESGYASVERDGQRLIQNPIDGYVGDNLSFVRGGFGDDHLPGPFDVIRGMNVLLYFDAAFRRRSEEWIASQLNEGGIFVCGANWLRSEYSRYSVLRKENGRLVHREFAFGLEAVRPLELVPFFALHADDVETRLAFDCVRALRADAPFRRLFDERMDAVQEELELCPRRPDGQLGGIDLRIGFVDLEPKLMRFMAAANAEDLQAAASQVLRGAGYETWRNEVGDTAIVPGSQL